MEKPKLKGRLSNAKPLTREEMKKVKGSAGCNMNAGCAAWNCYDKTGAVYCTFYAYRCCGTNPGLQVCNEYCPAGTTAYSLTCYKGIANC